MLIYVMSRPVQVNKDQLDQLLRNRLPNFRAIENFDPIPKPGRVNTVYKIDVLNQDHSRSSFILKVTNSTWNTRKTRNEARTLIELAKKLDLPISKVHCYEEIKAQSEIGHEFILMEYLEGTALSEIWSALSAANQRALLAQLAAVLAQFRTLEFEAIGNFTDDTNPWRVHNIVALEWQSAADIDQGVPVKIIGPLNSFQDYILNYLQPHFEMIENRNDPRVMPYLEAARQFCAEVILKTGTDSTNQRERFVLTHGDLNEGNILVAQRSGEYAISGLLDFEWAMSAPEEIEFHRGFRWLRQSSEHREQWWHTLWTELAARGVYKSEYYDEREDICAFERMISHLESYCDYFPDLHEREEFLVSKLTQLRLLLQKYQCGPLPDQT